jgi:hypothetical protein
VIASKQNYIIGTKDSKYRKGLCFPTACKIELIAKMPSNLTHNFENKYKKKLITFNF